MYGPRPTEQEDEPGLQLALVLLLWFPYSRLCGSAFKSLLTDQVSTLYFVLARLLEEGSEK